MFGDLITTGNTQIDSSLAYEGRDVCGGKEDERNWKVLDQSDVETGFAAELYVTSR